MKALTQMIKGAEAIGALIGRDEYIDWYDKKQEVNAIAGYPAMFTNIFGQDKSCR